MGTSWRHTLIDPRWSHDKKLRARVLLGFVLMLFISVAVISAHLLVVEGWAKSWLVVIPTAFVLGLVPYLVRRTGSVTTPAAVVLLWTLLILSFIGVTQGGMRLSLSPWAGLFALLSLYLLGPRLGLIYVVIAILQAVVSAVLHAADWTLPPLATTDALVAAVESVVGISLIGAVGYHYEIARRHTQGELEDALLAVEHSESQLSALIENTNAMICSVDTRHRLLVFNSAFAREVASHQGARPSAGEMLEQMVGDARMQSWQPHLERVLEQAEPERFEECVSRGGEERYRETSLYPLVQNGEVAGLTLFSYDITERKQAEARLRRLHEQLVGLSRQAGMAAVASEVLHNAGNILNSVMVSVSVLEARVRELKTGRLVQALELVEQHTGDLDAFLHRDPRGRQVMPLLQVLGKHFVDQERELKTEIQSLREGVAHLSQAIEAQQSYARSVSVIEEITADELIDLALSLQAQQWESLGIELERDIAALPPLQVDKHRVLEILINLLSNARHALIASGRRDKRLVVGAHPRDEADEARVCLYVEDNGVGIAEDVRSKLFQFGFTTKQRGQGIGLHSSANSAQQLGGELSVHSEGAGKGARFTLELPLRTPEQS